MRVLTAASWALLLAACPLQAGPLRHIKLRRNPPPRLAPIHVNAPRVAAAASDSAAQGTLKQMLQAENSLSLSGDQITMVARGGLDLSSEQQVQRRGAKALRIDYKRPARLAGEEIIDNGRFYCHLFPARDTLELSPSRIQTLRVRVPEVIRQMRSGNLIVQSAGQDTVAGHACQIVTAAARSASPVPFRKFWIDPTNGAQLRIEQYDAAGHLQSASYYTQVVYNPVFDKTAFRLPSAGGKVIMTGFAAPTLTLDQVRSQAGFAVQAPTTLPDGFHYQGGSASDLRGHRVIEMRYFNGANALSVFETPSLKDNGPDRTGHPRRGVLFGRQAGLKVVIIGNLENEEMNKVLASLK